MGPLLLQYFVRYSNRSQYRQPNINDTISWNVHLRRPSSTRLQVNQVSLGSWREAQSCILR
jgi:hypothetical protein